MNPKIKVIVYNFTAFIVFFLITRVVLGYFWPANEVFLAVTAAIIANFIGPKFGIIQTDKELKIMMNWFLLRGIREL